MKQKVWVKQCAQNKCPVIVLVREHVGKAGHRRWVHALPCRGRQGTGPCHPNAAKAPWFRVRWQGHPPSSRRSGAQHSPAAGRGQQNHALTTRGTGRKPRRHVQRRLAAATRFQQIHGNSAPPPTSKRGTKTAATTHARAPTASATMPPSRDARDTAHNNSLDATAAADHPPTDPTIKFTPQTSPTAHLLPNLTTTDSAKAQRADPRLRDVWNDTKTPATQRLHPERDVHNGLLTRTCPPRLCLP